MTDRDKDADGGFVVCGEAHPYLVGLRVHAESHQLQKDKEMCIAFKFPFKAVN